VERGARRDQVQPGCLKQFVPNEGGERSPNGNTDSLRVADARSTRRKESTEKLNLLMDVARTGHAGVLSVAVPKTK